MKSIRKSLNKTAQLMHKLELAGCTEEMINGVVNSKDNKDAINIVRLLGGNCVLIHKPLRDDGITILPIFSGRISLLFNTNKTDNDAQDHLDNFSQLINDMHHISVPEIKLQTFTLKEGMEGFQLRDAVGGEKKLVFKSKAEALRALGSTTTDKYRDGEATVVYWLDEAGVLYSASCRWLTRFKVWYCSSARHPHKIYLSADYRVLLPAIK